MSSETTSKFTSASGTTLSVLLCVILLFAGFIRQEMQHLALESRVLSTELALDALQTRLIHVSTDEDTTQNEKGKLYLVVIRNCSKVSPTTFRYFERESYLKHLADMSVCLILHSDVMTNMSSSRGFILKICFAY